MRILIITPYTIFIHLIIVSFNQFLGAEFPNSTWSLNTHLMGYSYSNIHTIRNIIVLIYVIRMPYGS